MLNELKSVMANFDLPAIIAQFYPASLAKPNRATTIRAVWRGDRRASFSLYHNGRKWLFFDHATLEHGDAYDFFTTVLGLSKRDAVAFFLGEVSTLTVPPATTKTLVPRSSDADATIPLGDLIRHYDYTDLAHDLVVQVLRYDPKDFRQRRPYGDGHWVWGVSEGLYYRNVRGDWTRRGRGESKFFPSAPKVVYQHPHVLQTLRAGERLVVVDGEKDVETLLEFGISATCVPKGMGSWHDAHSELLAGVKHMTVIADNEPQGELKAQRVCQSLLSVAGVPCKVTRVPRGKDVSDYVAAGATRDDLEWLLET
jgi:putative DNA primase/helicase